MAAKKAAKDKQQWKAMFQRMLDTVAKKAAEEEQQQKAIFQRMLDTAVKKLAEMEQQQTVQFQRILNTVTSVAPEEVLCELEIILNKAVQEVEDRN